MKHTITLRMVQVNKYSWVIESQEGHLMEGGIMLHSEKDALEYIKNYVSSFINWDYELVPMESKVLK